MWFFTRGNVRKNMFGEKDAEFSCAHNESEMSREHLETPGVQKRCSWHNIFGSNQHIAGNRNHGSGKPGRVYERRVFMGQTLMKH